MHICNCCIFIVEFKVQRIRIEENEQTHKIDYSILKQSQMHITYGRNDNGKSLNITCSDKCV